MDLKKLYNIFQFGGNIISLSTIFIWSFEKSNKEEVYVFDGECSIELLI